MGTGGSKWKVCCSHAYCLTCKPVSVYPSVTDCMWLSQQMEHPHPMHTASRPIVLRDVPCDHRWDGEGLASFCLPSSLIGEDWI